MSYLAGFAAMVPFFSTGLYSGPVANATDGADFSLFVGLPVAGVLYWVLCRGLDLTAERRLADDEAAQLEGAPARA